MVLNQGKLQKNKIYDKLPAILCILIGVLLFVNGFFKYEQYYNLEVRKNGFGSFVYLCSNSDHGARHLFFTFASLTVILLLLFLWNERMTERTFDISCIACCTVSLYSIIIGAVDGRNSFYYSLSLTPSIAPKGYFGGWISHEYVSLSFTFNIILALFIALFAIFISRLVESKK